MNGYFQLDLRPDGSYLKIFVPKDGGEAINTNEVAAYLQKKGILFDLVELNKFITGATSDCVYQLDEKKRYPEREMLVAMISQDRMEAQVRFYPPSTGGSLLSRDDILSDLNSAKIVYGVDTAAIDEFIKNRRYCENIHIASGQAVRHGTDASIEYFFNTDLRVRPTLNEDGSVDFFNLNTVNHIHEGDLLARLTKEDPGAPGTDVCGNFVKPRDVKKAMLKFGHNIRLSDDECEIYSEVDGHVVLTEGKVFVSNVYEVQDVGNSTGDIEYDGSVKVTGNVNSNFTIRAKGDVEVTGVVEGATIIADGNIIIAKGINGMGKGVLEAGGNVIVKYIENAKVVSGGYVESEAILHSEVAAHTEVNVVSKKGLLAGSHVTAVSAINCRTLGSQMGGDTVLELGVDPKIKMRIQELRNRIDSAQKSLAQMQPVLAAATQKLQQGIKMNPEQVKNISDMAKACQQLKEQLESDYEEMDNYDDNLDTEVRSQVTVKDTVYAGTKIVISDVSMTVKDNYKFCKFVKSQGDVKMTSM